MMNLSTPRRLIASFSVPLLVLAILWQVTYRENVRPLSFDNGYSWNNLPVHDEPWFWPLFIVLTTAWLWFVWKPGEQPGGS